MLIRRKVIIVRVNDRKKLHFDLVLYNNTESDQVHELAILQPSNLLMKFRVCKIKTNNMVMDSATVSEKPSKIMQLKLDNPCKKVCTGLMTTLGYCNRWLLWKLYVENKYSTFYIPGACLALGFYPINELTDLS